MEAIRATKEDESMTYRAYNVMVLVLLRVVCVALIALGLEVRKLGVGQAIWWSAVGLGIVALVISLVAIGFTATRVTEMPCPHCGRGIVARVKLGLGSGHLYISGKEKV